VPADRWMPTSFSARQPSSVYTNPQHVHVFMNRTSVSEPAAARVRAAPNEPAWTAAVEDRAGKPAARGCGRASGIPPARLAQARRASATRSVVHRASFRSESRRSARGRAETGPRRPRTQSRHAQRAWCTAAGGCAGLAGDLAHSSSAIFAAIFHRARFSGAHARASRARRCSSSTSSSAVRSPLSSPSLTRPQ
jgi:hypothetical protein